VSDGLIVPGPDDPMGVARILADEHRHGDKRTLRYWRGGWMTWRRSRWAELAEADVRHWLYTRLEDAVFRGKKGPEEWLPNRHRIGDVLDALRAVCHLAAEIAPPVWLDDTTCGPVVACTNGLLRLSDRTLLEHTPVFFNLVAVPFDYDPDAAEPVRWLQFLDDLWPDDAESVDALQEWDGYLVSGRTDFQKMLLEVGPTRSGKGVNAGVMKLLVGSGNHVGPTLSSLGANFGLAPLIGKALAVVSDARLEGATRLVVERLLSISGEDSLTIDRKYQAHWTGPLSTRIVVISNELPHLADASGAVVNRFVVLLTQTSFLGREDRELPTDLADEAPGILNWALEGLDRLERNGHFTEPKASRDAMTALLDLSSPVRAFVRDRCMIDPDANVSAETLYRTYKLWAEDAGHRVVSDHVFGRDLRTVVLGLRKTRNRTDGQRTYTYQGVALRPSGADDDPDF
jgi:putative DNA primase/helicase